MKLPNLFGIGPKVVLMASVPILVTAVVLWGVIDRVAQRIMYQHEFLDIDDDSHLRGWEVRASVFSLRSDVSALAVPAPGARPIGARLRELVTVNNTGDYSYRWAGYFGPDGRACAAVRWSPERGEAEEVVAPSDLRALDEVPEVRAAAGLARQQVEVSDVSPGVWQAGMREFRAAAPVYRGDATAPEGVVCVAMDFDRLERWVGRAPRHLTFLYDAGGRPVIYPKDIMTRQQAAALLHGSGPFAGLFSRLPEVEPGPPAPGVRQRLALEFQNRWDQIPVSSWPHEIHILRIGVTEAVKRPETRQELQDWLIATQGRHGDGLRVNRVVSKDDKFVYARSGDLALLNDVRQALRQHPALRGLTRTWEPIRCRHYSLRYQRLNYDPVKMERSWVLITGASREEILDDYWTERRPFLWGVTALLGATLGLTGLATHFVTGRLRQIRTAAEGLMAGRHDVALPTRARDETGVLARAFEAMIGQIRTRTEALEEGASRTQAILDMAAEGIITIDHQGRIEIFNRAAERILGYAAGEVLGRHVGLLMPDEGDPGRAGTLAHLLTFPTEQIIGRIHELTGRRKGGSTFPMEVAVGEARVGGRRVFTAIVRDITERKQMERERERRKGELEQAVRERTAELERTNEQLRAAKDAADAAMQTQETFLSGVAHDLRTPLASVIGYSEDLLEQAVDAELDDFIPDLKLVVNQGRYLNELVNDLLSMNEAINGRAVKLDLKAFDVPAVLRARMEGVADYLERKYNNRVVLDCPADLGAMTADEVRVWRVLMNLLSNASKNTRKGAVTLEARREADAAGEWVVFRVIDTGQGIAPEQQRRLFNRFETGQAEGGLERGFGLGLSICLMYCQAMGGTVRLEHSEPGKGSTFAVRLPAVVAGLEGAPRPRRHDAAGPAEPAPRDEIETNFVLIIDDDDALRGLMERRLSRDGFRTLSASSGEEGLRLAKQLLPSAIILDVVMPGIDGWAVLAALKTDAETSSIPVIMATMVDDPERGRALGADDYITKPFDRDRMSEVLHRHLDGGRAPYILVVEDDEAARQKLCQNLREQRWEVVEAADGREALGRIAQRRPDLILLDLMLPQVDGFEVIERIRHDTAWRDIPIIVITGIELDAEARRQLQGQVEEVLSKGLLGRDELMRHIRDLVASPPAHAPQPAETETETTDAEGALHRG